MNFSSYSKYFSVKIIQFLKEKIYEKLIRRTNKGFTYFVSQEKKNKNRIYKLERSWIPGTEIKDKYLRLYLRE